jgi:hypothetical protein
MRPAIWVDVQKARCQRIGIKLSNIPLSPALPSVKRGREKPTLEAPPSLRGRGLGWGIVPHPD